MKKLEVQTEMNHQSSDDLEQNFGVADHPVLLFV